MKIEDILSDKTIKSKEKPAIISKLLLEKKISINELIKIAKSQKDPQKADGIEAIEYATKQDPSVATKECLEFVSSSLTEKAPRIKWESAKVIGNIAQRFPALLDEALKNLLTNTEHSGTVVRWSAAYAIGEVIKLGSKYNSELIPAAEAICEREEKNSIKKIYMDALKKVKTIPTAPKKNKK